MINVRQILEEYLANPAGVREPLRLNYPEADTLLRALQHRSSWDDFSGGEAWAPFAVTRTVPDFWPEYMRPGVRDWILRGHWPGGYLTAVFEGRPFDAVCSADGSNFERFAVCMKWIAQCCPTGCFGSPKKAREWANAGGLEGMEG